MANPARAKGLMAGAFILTVAVSIATAYAGGKGAEYFKATDTNGDGALSKEEMAASRMQRLGATDADKDGFISADELAEHRAAMIRAKKDKHFSRFSSRFDANKDGKVSLDEIKAFDPPYFKKADADGDGKLTQEEMKAARKNYHDGMGKGMKDGMHHETGGE